MYCISANVVPVGPRQALFGTVVTHLRSRPTLKPWAELIGKVLKSASCNVSEANHVSLSSDYRMSLN